MKIVLLFIALAILPVSSVLAKSYKVDPEHTFVSFAVSHMGFSTVRGKFNQQSGSLEFDPDTKTASITIEIEAGSIDTGHVKRDNHLSSPDFLNVVESPTITFKSTKVSWNGNKLATVTGNLTVMGVSKPVTLKVTAMICGLHPFYKVDACGFDAEASIKRSDFGVNYGIPGIGDVLDLNIELEGLKK